MTNENVPPDNGNILSLKRPNPRSSIDLPFKNGEAADQVVDALTQWLERAGIPSQRVPGREAGSYILRIDAEAYHDRQAALFDLSASKTGPSLPDTVSAPLEENMRGLHAFLAGQVGASAANEMAGLFQRYLHDHRVDYPDELPQPNTQNVSVLKPKPALHPNLKRFEAAREKPEDVPFATLPPATREFFFTHFGAGLVVEQMRREAPQALYAWVAIPPSSRRHDPVGNTGKSAQEIVDRLQEAGVKCFSCTFGRWIDKEDYSERYLMIETNSLSQHLGRAENALSALRVTALRNPKGKKEPAGTEAAFDQIEGWDSAASENAASVPSNLVSADAFQRRRLAKENDRTIDGAGPSK